VSHVDKQQPLSQLATVLCYEGYLTPLSATYQSHCIGASYRRGKTDCDYSADEQRTNKQRLTQCLPHSTWASSLVMSDHARVAVRCAIRDHLPMVGVLSDYQQFVEQPARPKEQIVESYHSGLSILGGLGSRGLCSAPLAAEILASQLAGEALPLDLSTLNALHPGRFWIRKRIKGRPIS